MLEIQQNRDAIVLSAIEIASAAEREAFIAGACGNDTALRREVEERVARHFQAGRLENVSHAASNTPPPKRILEQVGANHAEAREGPVTRTLEVQLDAATEPTEARPAAQSYPRRLVATGAVLLLASAGVSIGLAVWALRVDTRAREAVQQAVDERDRARKAKKEATNLRDQALTARQTIADDRDRARAEAEAAWRSEQDAKAILAFLQNNLLSAGRPKGWYGNHAKDVTSLTRPGWLHRQLTLPVRHIFLTELSCSTIRAHRIE